MRGMKQEALAMDLGQDWSQRRVSLLEAKEEIEPEVLKQVAGVLKMPVEAFTDLDEDAAFNIISNTFHEQAFIISTGTFNINPIDKWMEALEEIKKLNSEKIQLYERMLKDKTEMVEKLEQMLLQKK